MNTQLYKGMKYHQAQATFHQWRDQRSVYGLNFQDAQVAQKFASEVQRAVERLEAAGGGGGGETLKVVKLKIGLREHTERSRTDFQEVFLNSWCMFL